MFPGRKSVTFPVFWQEIQIPGYVPRYSIPCVIVTLKEVAEFSVVSLKIYEAKEGETPATTEISVTAVASIVVLVL